MLHDVGDIAERVSSMVGRARVTAVDGSTIPIVVESVCVHGDSPGAVQIATAVRDRLMADGVRLRRSPDAAQTRQARSADYEGYFDQPAATAASPLTVTWAGVTTLLIDDGESAVMTDGFFSRPGLLTVVARALSPSLPRIDGCLARLNWTGSTPCCPYTPTSTTPWTRRWSPTAPAPR